MICFPNFIRTSWMESNNELMEIYDKDGPCPVITKSDIKHETSNAKLQLYVAVLICFVFIAGEVIGKFIKLCYQTH